MLNIALLLLLICYEKNFRPCNKRKNLKKGEFGVMGLFFGLFEVIDLMVNVLIE